MKIFFSLALTVALFGCATYRWVKPGATDADFSRDSYECQMDAAIAYPVTPVTNTLSSGYTASTMTNCMPYMLGGLNCTSFGYTAPPKTYTYDANVFARDEAAKACMYARGYRRVEVSRSSTPPVTQSSTPSSPPARQGAWVKAGSSDDFDSDDFVQYVDPSTIRRNGNRVKMSDMADYKALQGKPGRTYISAKAQYEYDCAEEKIRQLALTHYSGRLGSGNVVHSEGEGKWHPVLPGTIGEILWKVACGETKLE